MEELRDWMLIMLWLQHEAVPGWTGGSPAIYEACMERLDDDRSCAQVISLYMYGEKRAGSGKILPVLGLVRKCILIDDPPLIEELPKPKKGRSRGCAVLFRSTEAGRRRAQDLVADLPTAGREAIKTELREVARVKRAPAD